MAYPENRPRWYDTAYRTSAHLSARNQQAPIPKEDLLKLQSIAEKIIASNDFTESLLFLKILSEFSFYGGADIFFHLLQSLRNTNPKIDRYFCNIPIRSTTHSRLNEKGINQILHFFTEEYQHPPGVLSTTTASQIPLFIKKMMQSEKDSIRGWAVSNDQDLSDPHIVPVFAIRKQGKTHVFIFDSIGHVFSTNLCRRQISASLENLLEYFQDWPDKLDHQLAIYSYQIPRQSSDYACAIFTLLDLKNLLEMNTQENTSIIDFYTSQKENLAPKLSIQNLEPSIPLVIEETV